MLTCSTSRLHPRNCWTCWSFENPDCASLRSGRLLLATKRSRLANCPELDSPRRQCCRPHQAQHSPWSLLRVCSSFFQHYIPSPKNRPRYFNTDNEQCLLQRKHCWTPHLHSISSTPILWRHQRSTRCVLHCSRPPGRVFHGVLYGEQEKR